MKQEPAILCGGVARIFQFKDVPGTLQNILNAVRLVKYKFRGRNVITLSGFKAGNTLSNLGDVNINTPVENYGIVECYHQVLLHMVLDFIVASKKAQQ